MRGLATSTIGIYSSFTLMIWLSDCQRHIVLMVVFQYVLLESNIKIPSLQIELIMLQHPWS